MLVATNELNRFSGSVYSSPLQSASTATILKPDNSVQNMDTIPTYSGSEVTVPLTESPEGIDRLEVNGVVFAPTNNSTPQTGQYYYDYSQQQIIINTSFNASGLSVLYSYPEQSNLIGLKVGDNLIPNFFSQYNITGEFTIQRQFQGSPSANLTIIDDVSKKQTILNFFEIGRQFNIKSLGFRVNNVSFTIEDLTGKITVLIAFQGIWEALGDTIDNPLDEPVSIRDLVSKDSDGYYYTANMVARRVGVAISSNSRKIRVSSPISPGSAVKLRELLTNERFYPDGKIIDWESPNKIRLRTWANLPYTVITDWIPPRTLTYGFKSKVTNAVLSIDNVVNNEGDKYSTVETGRSDYFQAPRTLKQGYYEAFDINNLQTASWCFDITTEKTIHTITTQLNGEDLEIIEEEWGYVYTSVDTHTYYLDNNGVPHYIFSPSEAAVNATWQKVKETIKTFLYDFDNYGYLVKVSGKVKELRRLKQEQEKESIIYQYQIDQETDEEAIANLEKSQAAYSEFFWIEYPYQENFTLEDLIKYYPKLAKTGVEEDNVKPFYSKEYLKQEGVFLNYPDPDSSEDDPKSDIILSTLQREQQQTLITSTFPQRYKVINNVMRQEEKVIKQSAYSQTEEEQNGVPGQASRIEKLNKTAPNTENDEDVNSKRWLISTDNSMLSDNIENGSVSFPDITELSDAETGVQTQYEILNSQNEVSGDISLKYPINLVIGQRVIVSGQIYRVFSMSEQWKIAGVITLDSINLAIGLEQEETVQSRKIE